MEATKSLSKERDLSIIVPAFNESKVIFKTIKEIEKTMENLGLDYEVIVVDDGSKDNTYEETRKIENLKR
jgi:dolichol-phosphate mannosyltransferase